MKDPIKTDYDLAKRIGILLEAENDISAVIIEDDDPQVNIRTKDGGYYVINTKRIK